MEGLVRRSSQNVKWKVKVKLQGKIKRRSRDCQGQVTSSGRSSYVKWKIKVQGKVKGRLRKDHGKVKIKGRSRSSERSSGQNVISGQRSS